MKLKPEILKRIINAIAKTREDEIGCEECFNKLNTFVEQKLEGKSPEIALPLVHDHLLKCKDCREEYEALLVAISELI